MTAINLLNKTITAAASAQLGSNVLLSDGPLQNALLQATFTYGSGGTSADAWVQSSVDGGLTWTDCANFHFLTTTARLAFNLSSLTAVTTQYTPTDGTLTANTAKDGVLGQLWRVKYTTVGTYAGGTILRVDAFFNGPLDVGYTA
jgi:hypothetical protein